ncbi:MAG TPA: endolytic transglycosylase MltG [Gemmatimonadales bacterium]|nr:endolytic transglycosylase MltG [Gemmatimonadales bacterium]
MTPRAAIPLALGVVIAACGAGRSPCETAAPHPACVAVTIPRGASLAAAVDTLAADRVIGHPVLFRWYARLRGLGGSLKSGTYAFQQPESWSALYGALSTGRGLLVRFTVPEGLRMTEIADLAQKELGVPRDSFLAAAGDSSVLSGLGLAGRAPSAEGYLFPTTYNVHPHPGARTLVRAMVQTFLLHWRPEWTSRLDSLHWTRQQLVTFASIVEAEVRYPPDRPFVSAVYHNRLARGMKLEADPTVIYAYGHRLKRVFERNLLVRSPYNTYLHAGLPPGPICQPGDSSLTAALYPAPVPWIYFVAQPDGKHIFSATFAEHEAAVNRVRRMRTAGPTPRVPAH